VAPWPTYNELDRIRLFASNQTADGPVNGLLWFLSNAYQSEVDNQHQPDGKRFMVGWFAAHDLTTIAIAYPWLSVVRVCYHMSRRPESGDPRRGMLINRLPGLPTQQGSILPVQYSSDRRILLQRKRER
jgi:hypothetical protein